MVVTRKALVGGVDLIDTVTGGHHTKRRTALSSRSATSHRQSRSQASWNSITDIWWRRAAQDRYSWCVRGRDVADQVLSSGGYGSGMGCMAALDAERFLAEADSRRRASRGVRDQGRRAASLSSTNAVSARRTSRRCLHRHRHRRSQFPKRSSISVSSVATAMESSSGSAPNSGVSASSSTEFLRDSASQRRAGGAPYRNDLHPFCEIATHWGASSCKPGGSPDKLGNAGFNARSHWRGWEG